MGKEQKQLILNKGKEKYIFRYEAGCEDRLMDAIVDGAGDVQTDFDWFDAAVLSFKLTQSLIFEADEILSNKCNTEISS
jgi:hypothetical protein